MKIQINSQSYQRLITAIVVVGMLLVGMVSMQLATAREESYVINTGHVEEVAEGFVPGMYVPNGNFWSG